VNDYSNILLNYVIFVYIFNRFVKIFYRFVSYLNRFVNYIIKSLLNYFDTQSSRV
jgi:hypothetical protein